jgi:2-hydroxychromene-2-carboxylate isomerase
MNSTASAVSGQHLGVPVVLYGDFAGPWSYLASRRAHRLEAAGVAVIDWRAVRSLDTRRWLPDVVTARLETARAVMPEVIEALLPGEDLPVDLGERVPFTEAAQSAYAEAYVADRADAIRRILFQALWIHHLDVNDPEVLRTLLCDVLMDSDSPSEVVRESGMVPSVTRGPISTQAWEALRMWTREWQQFHTTQTPVLQLEGRQGLVGREAVDWLGAQLSIHGLLPTSTLGDDSEPARLQHAGGFLPGLSWMSINGGHWVRQYHLRYPSRTWQLV